MTEDQIKHMVDKFLSYRFPEDIQPDGGLSIRRVFNEGTPHEFKATPSGTNLLNATQATEMVRHMLSGFPHTAGTPPQQGDGWQDIASAPRDGTRVLLMLRGPKPPETIARWDQEWTTEEGDDAFEWVNDEDDAIYGTPTHWAPLPPPPGAKP